MRGKEWKQGLAGNRREGENPADQSAAANKSYSVHDLRYAFAVQLYEATRDVYQVEKALGHATVAVTEVYLRSLGIER